MGFLKEPSHLIIVALILVILFGSRRLPDAARGLGQSMRIFKAEVKQMQNEDRPKTAPAQPSAEAPLEGRVVNQQPVPHVERVEEQTPRDL
jgi:sec-independent protein translocase protein TatA